MENVRCSFCDKSRDQVQRMVSGPGGVYICNECIDVCRQVMDEESVKFDDIREALKQRKQNLDNNKPPLL